jgi:tetratricopeptide (TPR) repeat protein
MLITSVIYYIKNLLILNKFTYVISCLVLVVAISGCSRKKDKFINRAWHAVGTEYNILYNGDLALQQGKKEVADSYNENFWDILPVERMQISEEITLPGTVKNESFRLAEEKATKAIQKHSMLIKGKENNPQIDEAYLLLGKARYFDQRFFPALEAFNYILHKYPASNTINHAQIWREKTNIRLQNNKLAIKNLKRIIKAETLKDQDRADANAMLAQAYINTNYPDSAVVPIRTAAEYTDNNDEKGRYYFIQGQLYNLSQKRDSANYVFDKIIELNRKTPREYIVNAQIEKSRNFNFDNEDPTILLASLREMEENRENRPFLDKIYFQIAEYYTHIDSTRLATEYYNKSLKEPSEDKYLLSLNYETLGNINFDKGLYKEASAYYDSTLTNIPINSRDYFFVQRKRDNLSEVIYYENIAIRNDSILRFVAMPEEERLDYFTKYAENLKEAAVTEAKQGEIPEAVAPAIPGGRNTPGAPPALGGNDPANTFYFYNSRRVTSGLESFIRVWGARELRDNWRLNSTNFKPIAKDGLDEVSELIISNNPNFIAQTYLDQIPSDPLQISELEKERNDAYYSLGLIYMEKFNKPDLASEKLKALLSYTEEERLVIPANYYLYKINFERGNTFETEKYKQIVLENYPDSRYAARINNPDLAIALEDEAENKYKDLYSLFENAEFVKVIEGGKTFINEYPEEELLPKTELLKARAMGRIYGVNAYKEELSLIVSNYPQAQEGVTALELLNTAIPEMEKSNFEINNAATNLKLLYELEANDTQAALKLKETLEKAILELDYAGLSISQDVYNASSVFVVVHGLENYSKAEGFAELLNINKKYKVQIAPVIVSSENYRVIQLKKNLEAYIELINKQEP